MPQEFYMYTRKIRLLSVMNVCCLLTAIFCVGLSLELLINRRFDLAVLAFALLFSLCVVIMVFIARHTHLLSADTEPYCVPLFLESKDAIISALGAKEIENTVYASVIAIKGYSTRIMIQEAEPFDKSLMSKQRKKANQILNKQLNAHSEVPLYSALKMIRINLVICEKNSPSLHEYLSRSTSNLLSRNEIVIPAAVILSEQKMLYPKCTADVTPNQLSRYTAVATYLVDRLNTVQ